MHRYHFLTEQAEQAEPEYLHFSVNRCRVLIAHYRMFCYLNNFHTQIENCHIHTSTTGTGAVADIFPVPDPCMGYSTGNTGSLLNLLPGIPLACPCCLVLIFSILTAFLSALTSATSLRPLCDLCDLSVERLPAEREIKVVRPLYSVEVTETETAKFETEISEEDVHATWKLKGETLHPSAVRTPLSSAPRPAQTRPTYASL